MPAQSSGTRPAKRFSAEVTTQVVHTLRWNSRLNLAARLLLMLFCLGCAIVAVVYVYQRADAMVELLRQPRTTGEMIGERLLALTAPVLLLAILIGLAAAAAVVAHSRGADETNRTLDSINRLRREDEVAVSARGLVVAFEEQLATARRAFTLLLWFGRSLFVVSLGLFVVATFDALLSGVDWSTVGLGAGSLGGAVFGVAQKVPRTVTHHLTNVLQLQSIVTGMQRQTSLLESNAFAALNDCNVTSQQRHAIVLEVQDRMDRVMSDAVKLIERYADPAFRTDDGAGEVVQFPHAA